MIPTLTLMIALLGATAFQAAGTNPSTPEALEISQKVLGRGAAIFDRKDAAAMGNTFDDNAKLRLITRDDSTGTVREESRSGRFAIESFYRDLFDNDLVIVSKNEVEYARLVQPDLLLIAGTFQIKADDDVSRYPFVQTRVLRDERWLVREMRVFVFNEADN